MKIKQNFIVFLVATLFIGCGNKAKDIDVNDFKTECDVIDAYILVLNEMDDFSGSIDFVAPSDKQKEKFKAFKDKLFEIKDYRKENFSLSRLKICQKYPEYMKKVRQSKNMAKEKGLL